jgi:hypothetical protein
MNPTRRRSTRASLPFTLPSKELTATDWAGLVETAIGKDSKGYLDRLRRWILTTNNNPKCRLAQVASVRLASFWYQELVHAADYLDRKNADYQMCLTDLPDDEGDLSRDLFAMQTVQDNEDEDGRSTSDTDTDHGDRTDSPRSALPQCDAGSDPDSDSYSAPLDGSWEEHRQWIADGCPDSD